MAESTINSNIAHIPSALPPELGDQENANLVARSAETRSILAPTSPGTRLFGILSEQAAGAIPVPLLHRDNIDLLPSLASILDDSGMRSRTSKPGTPLQGAESALNEQGSTQRPTEVGRPLNVTDALSYLDAVKNQFNDKPEVYNQFLDIMKDFKSQVIDTPGVIQRVSRLFHGNPYLIQGFNTFLPIGYRIDISADPSDPNTITVTTPSGTTTQNTNSFSTIPRPTRELSGLPGPNSLLYPAGPIVSTLAAASPASRALTPHGYQLGAGNPQQPLFDPAFSPSLQNPQTTAAASFLGNLNKTNTMMEQPPGEFNHAIQYLNKIKARYSDDPNTYKQFLDILQTYQKEQRHLHDSQVYVQVQMLFKDAPDLISEFKAFLPEITGGAGISQEQGGVLILPQPPPGAPSTSWNQAEMRPPTPPPIPPKKSTQPTKRKKRVAEKEPTPAPPPTKAVSSRQNKKVKHHHIPDTGSPSFSPYVAPRSPPETNIHHASQTQPPLYMHNHTGNTSADKLLFFDRAKKSLENREMYEEFLKLLSLFSKEIIDVKTLIERTKVFLGDESLMTEFKDLVGWDERMENSTEYGPPGSIRTAAPDACAPQPVDDGEGPSYRRLPDSEIRLACSGRDELCRSVLNDEWVSHPTWASEEAGFVAHKKNSFEEALHKSEEERHEYHVHIQALTRTIAVLEPLHARIEEMTMDERSLFKLKPDFGGSSKAIYYRTLKRVYGRDSGLEVIQALQDCPSVAIPVVLSRLKQKDEEWRRAQREWSRTWREVDSKNFYKSLDHQGISFKQNDKKNITAKHFVADIEAIKVQQLKTWEEGNVQAFSRGSPGHQLEYTFNDTSVLLDSLKMVYSFLDRSQVQYSALERRSVEKFLRAFIPRLCNYPEAEFNAACGPLEGSADDEVLHEINGHAEGPRSGRRSIESTHSAHSNGIPASDLRKKLLKTAQEKATRKVTRGSTSVTSTPPLESRFAQLDDEGRAIPDIWIREGGGGIPTENTPPDLDLERPFFANTTFYTLLRLLQLLYSRLLICKEIGAQLAAQKHVPLLANHVAVELGLDDNNGPSSVLAQTMDVLGDRGSGAGANVVYMYLLNACEKLFDNDMDQATFEEHMRWFFGTKAYHLFTLDKLITSLIKQVQTILSDNRCQELWSLLQIAQGSDNITNQDIIRYRRSAEKHVGQDDHLYRLQWTRETKFIRVSLTGPDDATIQTDAEAISRWREYVNTYVMTYPTEWLPPVKQKVSPALLRRHIQADEEGTASMIQDDHSKIHVSFPTYRLVYESGCEYFIWRDWDKGERDMLRERARSRNEERRKTRWLSTQV